MTAYRAGVLNGWISMMVGTVAVAGWTAGWNVYVNLAITGGWIAMLVVAWIAGETT